MAAHSIRQFPGPRQNLGELLARVLGNPVPKNTMTRAAGDRFSCTIRCEDGRWLALCTWRLGYRGPYVVRGINELDLRRKLHNLDPTLRFYTRERL